MTLACQIEPALGPGWPPPRRLGPGNATGLALRDVASAGHWQPHWHAQLGPGTGLGIGPRFPHPLPCGVVLRVAFALLLTAATTDPLHRLPSSAPGLSAQPAATISSWTFTLMCSAHPYHSHRRTGSPLPAPAIWKGKHMRVSVLCLGRPSAELLRRSPPPLHPTLHLHQPRLRTTRRNHVHCEPAALICWAHASATSAPGLTGLSPLPHLRRDWANPSATSAPRLGSPLCHICSATGLAPLPHLLRD